MSTNLSANIPSYQPHFHLRENKVDVKHTNSLAHGFFFTEIVNEMASKRALELDNFSKEIAKQFIENFPSVVRNRDVVREVIEGIYNDVVQGLPSANISETVKPSSEYLELNTKSFTDVALMTPQKRLKAFCLAQNAKNGYTIENIRTTKLTGKHICVYGPAFIYLNEHGGYRGRMPSFSYEYGDNIVALHEKNKSIRYCIISNVGRLEAKKVRIDCDSCGGGLSRFAYRDLYELPTNDVQAVFAEKHNGEVKFTILNVDPIWDLSYELLLSNCVIVD